MNCGLRIADCGLKAELRHRCPDCGLAHRVCADRLYKQTQFRPLCRSGDRGSQGANVRNKPNFRSGASDGKCFMGKWLWRIRPARSCEKTKPISTSVLIGKSAFAGSRSCETNPIRPVRRTRWTWNPPSYAAPPTPRVRPWGQPRCLGHRRGVDSERPMT
jgi:hypothetical protein